MGIGLRALAAAAFERSGELGSSVTRSVLVTARLDQLHGVRLEQDHPGCRPEDPDRTPAHRAGGIRTSDRRSANGTDDAANRPPNPRGRCRPAVSSHRTSVSRPAEPRPRSVDPARRCARTGLGRRAVRQQGFNVSVLEAQVVGRVRVEGLVRQLIRRGYGDVHWLERKIIDPETAPLV